jgi:hypothetical protein
MEPHISLAGSRDAMAREVNHEVGVDRSTQLRTGLASAITTRGRGSGEVMVAAGWRIGEESEEVEMKMLRVDMHNFGPCLLAGRWTKHYTRTLLKRLDSIL